MEAVDTGWRKSSYSGNGGGSCIETASADSKTLVRDSKLGDRSPVIAFSTDAWRRFTDQIQDAELGSAAGRSQVPGCSRDL
jgi:hypothetical protein